MNITNTNTKSDISYSDNSHIFGRPIRISLGADGFMDIPIIGKDGRRSFDGLGEWCERVFFLEKAGLKMHLRYVAMESLIKEE